MSAVSQCIIDVILRRAFANIRGHISITLFVLLSSIDGIKEHGNNIALLLFNGIKSSTMTIRQYPSQKSLTMYLP